MTRFEIAPPCRVAAPPGASRPAYTPWLEAALWVRVTVPEWQLDESAWTHWAVPASAPAAAPRPFDPGRFAVVPGEPDVGAVAAPARIGEGDARELVAAVVARWQPSLHRQPDLGLVSRLDEPREGFRKRCLTLLRPLLQQAGGDREAVAARMARVAAGVESIVVGREHLEVRHARVAVVWYPDGREPAARAAELMVSGAVRGGR